MKRVNIILILCLWCTSVVFGQQRMKPHLNQFQKSETPVQLENLRLLQSLSSAVPPATPNILDYNLNDFSRLGTLNKPTQIPSFLIKTDAKTGLPIYIKGSLPDADDKLEEQAWAYLTTLQATLQIEDASTEFALVKKSIGKAGRTHLRLQQMYRGVKVYGAEILLHARDGKIDLLTGRYFPTPKLRSVEPKISKSVAVQTAFQDVGKRTNVKQLTPMELRLIAGKQAEAELVVYHKNRDSEAESLAWAITLRPNVAHQWAYFVDATTGAILHQFSEICRLHHRHAHEPLPTPAPLPPRTATARDLFNTNRTFNVWQEGDTLYLIDASRPMFNAARSSMPDEPIGVIWTIDGLNTSPVNDDFTVDHVRSTNNQWNVATSVSAHYNAGRAYEYFSQTFNRNAIDGQGGNIVSLINISEDDGSGMDNAFWNGAAMFYGNGNVAFEPLARGLDVAGHEMTHGVIQNEANLEYQDEPGALNESFADVFGAMIDRDDWQIGEDVARTQVFPSGALRDMADPNNGGTSLNDNGWQPSHVSEQYRGSEDNGGVHINSGIPNRAFYLFATAVGRDVAEQVFYDVLSNYLARTSQFIDLRLAVIEAATNAHGQSVADAAANAFDMVGITTGQGSEVPTDVSVNSGDEFILYSNGDQTTLNIVTPNGQAISTPLTDVGALSKPSVTDDGSVIVYVARDQTLQAIFIDWNTLSASQQTLSEDPIWRNAVVSKDGNRLAAITDDFDNRIFVFDFSTNQTRSQAFQLFNPTFTQGVSTGDVAYADAMEFDFSGEFLMYDALNTINNTFGEDIEYWDIGFLRVWNNATNNFGDGSIQKLFTALPNDISIGNPSFSKNSPFIVAFDYADFFNEEYFVLGVNFQTGDVGTIWQNPDLGFPNYSTDDSRLIFDGSANNSSVVAITELADDKINGTGSAFILVEGDFSGARWGVWFANGERVLTSNEALTPFEQSLEIFPNPFQEIVYLRGESATSGVLRVEVFNQLGQRLQSENFSVGGGTWQEPLHLRNLAAGSYVIRVSAGDASVSRTVLKLR